MNYIMQLTDYFRKVHGNITAFRFVIYSPDWHINARKYHWIKVKDLPGGLDRLWQQKIDLAQEHQLHPAELSIGLTNSVLVAGSKSGRSVIRYFPMIDFDSCQAWGEEAPELIVMALEVLGMCPGIIVRSSVMHFGLAGFHFFGFGLWRKERWDQFVADGIFDEYRFSNDPNIPMFPKMPYFAAKIIGEQWCRLVARQRGMAFLRVTEKNYLNSQPQVLELFFGGSKLLEEPPDHAPCMPPYRVAKEKWYDTVDEMTRYIDGHSSRKYTYESAPKIQDFCLSDCPINGCSLECPATEARFERKPRRVKGNSEKKQPKLLSE